MAKGVWRFLALAAPIRAAVAALRRRGRRRRRPVCPACGFAAGPGAPACPRCGRALDPGRDALERLEGLRRRGEIDEAEYRRRKLAAIHGEREE